MLVGNDKSERKHELKDAEECGFLRSGFGPYCYDLDRQRERSQATEEGGHETRKREAVKDPHCGEASVCSPSNAWLCSAGAEIG